VTRVAVFGASGRTGRIIVDELLAAGYEVTAAVGNPGNFATDAQRVVRADVRDETSVREAVAGHDAVVSTIGSGRRPGGLYSASAKYFVSALQDAKVNRLGGLPVGAVVMGSGGEVVAEGRNRAYDPPGGDDRLQGSPIAHAEMNALARIAVSGSVRIRRRRASSVRGP
jgi:putative NADH-flavin reductase